MICCKGNLSRDCNKARTRVAAIQSYNLADHAYEVSCLASRLLLTPDLAI